MAQAAMQSAFPLDKGVSRFLGSRTHKLLIDGKWVEAASGKTFTTVDPSTEEPLAEVAAGEKEDVDRAVRAARQRVRGRPVAAHDAVGARPRDLEARRPHRGAHGEEFAQLETLDNGKPISVARVADIPLVVDHFRYYAGWATKVEGETIPVSTPGLHMLNYTLREPVGVIGQIIPWNFPLLMAAWKLGVALACGNTVVLKPAEQTPLSALRLGELFEEAGFPPGVVNIVTGFGETAGAAIAEHPDIDKVAFTGSTDVGRIIMRAAAGNLKRVSLELGGKSPNIIFADADLDAGRHRRRIGDLLQPRPVLLRRLATVHRAEGVRQGHAEADRILAEGEARPRHGSHHRDGPAGIERAVRARHRLPRAGQEGRRQGAGRRRPPGAVPQGLLRLADRVQRRAPRHEGRPRGDLRTGRLRRAVQGHRGRARRRQRHRLRPRRGGVDDATCRRRTAWPRI